MIGNDFEPRIYPHKVWCSECNSPIPAGVQALVSVRKGKVRKIICGENCRLAFDARFWDAVARRNSQLRKGRTKTK